MNHSVGQAKNFRETAERRAGRPANESSYENSSPFGEGNYAFLEIHPLSVYKYIHT